MMDSLTFAELCHMAGYSETYANFYGLTRSEIISLINQK